MDNKPTPPDPLDDDIDNPHPNIFETIEPASSVIEKKEKRSKKPLVLTIILIILVLIGIAVIFFPKISIR